MRKRISGRYALAMALVLVLGVPAVAAGFGEGNPLKLGKRNPSSNPTRDIQGETEIIADSGTYGTRQSNKRVGDGGGAIYGCRSGVGKEPCVKAKNLNKGRAFEFETGGTEGGRINVGDTKGAPLTTNATGVATGFNADKVDGKDADEFAAASGLKFAAVAADGKLAAGRGAKAAAISDAAKNTYTITFDADVSKCSFTAGVIGGSADFALGVEPVAGKVDQVTVDQRDKQTDNDPATVENPGRAFHLQVIC